LKDIEFYTKKSSLVFFEVLAEAFSSQLIFTIFFRQNACFKNPEEIFTAGQCFLCYKDVRKYFDFEEKIIIECPCWLKDIKPPILG
jgi:hypothetical protein